MQNIDGGLNGLTFVQAKKLQEKYGKNELSIEKKETFFHKIVHIISEPMFLLLIVAATIYFILGEPKDGAIMLVFVFGIISISVIQEWKTDKTLNALKELSAPQILVVREGQQHKIASVDLVVGDIMILQEGVKIPADGVILKCNDLCVDESTLTGESQGIWKVTTQNVADGSDYWRKDYCYASTLVTQGSAYVLVEKIGLDTEYGKIGQNVTLVKDEMTPLQKQTASLVKLCAGIAGVLFALVSAVTYFDIPDHIFKDRIVESILSGITLAMAMIPEEFPVILTVFLSMGAWRLAKKNSLVRRLPSVETLGAVSVLCVDKTGTITLNKMTVQNTFTYNTDQRGLCEIMGLGCETDAYDPMEKAMIEYCDNLGFSKEELFSGELIYEYAFTNDLKMMGHVWKKDEKIIVAAKGSPEKIMTICNLSEQEKQDIQNEISQMSSQGLRVIAVGVMYPQNEREIPTQITDCALTFCGLIGLADPPRESVKKDIETCIKAGIRVVMITGDNGITASSIAKKIGMENADNIITGEMLDKMSDEELCQKVKSVSIFSRVIPEHKMRIVKCLKDNGEIVAMTGDGVNDAPALKYADIGIAMGKRGSEVSREAADLILMDDNFSTIVQTVKDGRRIYDNIRKAVGYVFTIHIPIALASLIAPMMGIAPASLMLLPLHVVLLELVIDPTCSVVLERQPPEKDIMQRKPRKSNEKIISTNSLIKSLIQGLVIFASSFGIYYISLKNGSSAEIARTLGLTVIMFANLFLVQVNSSDSDFALKSMLYLIKDKVMWIVNIATIMGVVVIVYSPLHNFLKLESLSINKFATAILVGALSVFWYEIVKIGKRMKSV